MDRLLQKNLAQYFFEKGQAGGKRTFARWRGLYSFMPLSVGGSADGSIDGLFDGFLVS